MERKELMNFKRKLSKLRISNFLALTIAGMINAFGVTVFLAPVKLYDSGISGTSMLLSHLTTLQGSKYKHTTSPCRAVICENFCQTIKYITRRI